MIYWIALGVVALLIILVEGVEAGYRRTSQYKRTLGGVERFSNIPEGIEICNIGSGPGLYAISYNECEKKGFNFSTAPQNHKYGFRILKKFSGHIKKGATVIIVIMSPLSFGNNNDYDRKDYNDRYYGLLPKEDIDNYSLKRYYIAKHPFLIRILKKVKKIVSVNSEYNKPSMNDMPSVVQTWKREFRLNDLSDPIQGEKHRGAYKEKNQILQEGINYCYSMGWKPVLITPPIPQKTRTYIGEDFLKEFVYQNVEILLENNPELQYFNYFDETLPDEYFINDIFMNEKGKRYFSAELFRDLNI